MKRFRFILCSIALLSLNPAAAATSYYVDEAVRPRPADARDHVLAFRDDGAFFRIDTRLGRAPLKRAMERGYFLYCGKWRREAGDAIAATYSLLEAYRYKPEISGSRSPQLVAHWSNSASSAVLGDALLSDDLPLRRSAMIEVMSESEADRFWHACADVETGGAR
jgi:hypothetical protein